MKVHFFTPPPAQRVGGLDAAIAGLRGALATQGVTVHGDEHFEGPDEAAGNALPTSSKNDASLSATIEDQYRRTQRVSSLIADADLVHFHGLWQSRHAALACECRTRGVPYVVSPHGMLEPWAWRHKWWKKWPYFWLVERRYLAKAGGILATASAEAARLQCFLPRQRIDALPLGLTGTAGVDYAGARQRLGWAADERVLLFLSRIHVKKGLDILLRALAELAPRNTRLVVVGGGDPDYVHALQTLAAKHRSTLPPIDWIGEIWGNARWSYFQGADLFCLPTHSENFGLAVLEALQVGTPTLTTRATPWADELGEGRGYISDPSVESVREQLACFFNAPPTAPACRERIAHWTRARFAWTALAPRYVELYRSLHSASRP